MKKLHLIILLLAVTLGGMAQTIGEAFYIYRNDGQFNVFFRDEVQSIEYSYADEDGNLSASLSSTSLHFQNLFHSL